MANIKVRVSKTGEVTGKAEGFVGHACLDAMKILEEAMGSISTREYTEEYYTEIQG